MKKHNHLAFILLALFIVGCGDSKKLFTIDINQSKNQFSLNETIKLKVKNSENAKIDSVSYSIDSKKIGKSISNNGFDFSLKNEKLGEQIIIANVFYEGNKEIDSLNIEIISDIKPRSLKYTLVNTFKHDTSSFTEGFEFHKDTLYESTGEKGNSYFRKYNYKTGQVYSQKNLDAMYFGEGITILNNKLYQFTWQQKVGFVYNLKTLEKEKDFTFDSKISEGWGATNDATNIIQSDGTNKIWFLKSDDLSVINSISVYSGETKIESLNEIEYVNGKLFANIWHKNAIAQINPKNGAVEGILDVSKLVKLVSNTSEERVLNGIAYNSKTQTFFIVGKNWDKMFEIKIE